MRKLVLSGFLASEEIYINQLEALLLVSTVPRPGAPSRDVPQQGGMDGWLGGWIGGRLDGGANGWMDEWSNFFLDSLPWSGLAQALPEQE